MKRSQPAQIALTVCLSLLAAVIMTGRASAADAPKPLRSIVMAAEFPGVVVGQEETVSMDLIFHNKGRTDENVTVALSEVPDGWKAKVKTYRFDVTGLHVPAEKSKTLTFEARPDEGTGPGDYRFRVTSRTADGAFKMDQTILVAVTGERAETGESTGVSVATSYPVVRGPSDGTFEFSLDVTSDLDDDAVFDLFAQGPEGWEINFKPAYESKFITGLRLKGKQNQSIAVEVKPAINSPAGEFPILVRVSSGEAAKSEVKLTVILIGTYALEAGTTSGLLSLEARQGKPANISFYVRNSGTAVSQDIKFLSFKPENWKVEFKPEKIDAIAPGDLEQVEMIITPYEEALVGDYSVGVQVGNDKVKKDLEFRTTVKASPVWGWIGIGIIVLVVLGLFAMFRFLGRR
jgi:uncharacterized membrane protein